MAGRSRSDSLHNKTELFDDTGITPPVHCKLRPEDMPYWDAIIRARAKASWTVVDLHHAANMARCLCDIERIQHEIEQESDVVENARGTQILNPKHNLLETLTRRSLVLSKHVQVHAVATVGDADKQKGKNSAASKARVAAEKTKDDDGLLARPS